eukprot:1997302-Alexandrium_andersonii.AAC.1
MSLMQAVECSSQSRAVQRRLHYVHAHDLFVWSCESRWHTMCRGVVGLSSSRRKEMVCSSGGQCRMCSD